MLFADNDNAPTLVLVTNKETVARFRALRAHLDLESDAELLDLALEARGHATVSSGASSRPLLMDANLTLTLPRETFAELAAERMRSGMSYEEAIRKALHALAVLSGTEPMRGELAS